MTAARVSHATLRTWFHATPGAMVAIDTEGRILLANASAARIFGYTATRMRGMTAADLMVEPWPRPSRSGRAPARAVNREGTGVTRTGRRIPVEIHVRAIMVARRPVRVAAIRDISRTRRFRDAMVRARRDSHVAIIGRLALVSPDSELAIRRMLEIAAAALELPALAILAADWQHRELRVHLATGLTTTAAAAVGAAFGDEELVRAVYRLGVSRAVTLDRLSDASAEMLRDRFATAGFHDAAMLPLSGRAAPAGILVAFTRAPARIDPEQLQFLESIANLVASAVQRSRAEIQLAHAQRLDAIGQLTGGIAHDFNNLLTVISGNLQLLAAELPDRTEAQESIVDALRAVDRGSALTRRLLTFARRQPLQPRAVVPQPLLQELAHMLRRTLGEPVDIEVDCPVEVPDLYADPNELDTALVNLALNARDAMPRGGRLSVTARELVLESDNDWKVDAGRYVALTVGDTGTGMPPEVQARAIEPFFTTKGSGKGSGLGLSMVYGFATQSGGALAIDSRLGYGTRVELLLPVARAEAAAVGSGPSPATSTPARRRTVLVVEDECDVRTIAARFLHALGYRVLAAASAREALAALRDDPDVDLLFSDVMLGSGGNGLELAEAVRRQRPGISVLLTSGYPRVDDSPQAQRPPFPLLRKPYRREQLLAAVERALAAG